MWFPPINVLFITIFIQSSHAYSLGAPDAACKRMTPVHGFDAVNQSPDPSGAPVKLTLNPPDGSDIVPGQTVSVSLEAQGEPFKGHNGAKFLSNSYWKDFCQRKLLNFENCSQKVS